MSLDINYTGFKRRKEESVRMLTEFVRQRVQGRTLPEVKIRTQKSELRGKDCAATFLFLLHVFTVFALSKYIQVSHRLHEHWQGQVDW